MTAVSEGLYHARAAIERLVRVIPSHPISDYNCTLILIAWVYDTIAAIQVGDGAAIVQKDDSYTMLTIPLRGEYANETYFITEPRHRDIVFPNETSGINAVTLFTDGLQRLAIDFAAKKADQSFMHDALAAIRTPLSNQHGKHHTNANSAAGNNRLSQHVFGWPDCATTNPEDTALLDWLCSPEVAQNVEDDATIIVATKHGHDHQNE